MLQVDCHQLRIFCRRVFYIEVCQRQLTDNVILVVLGDVFRHLLYIFVAGCDISVLRSQSLMVNLACTILRTIRYDLSVIRIGNVEDFILIHTVDSIVIRWVIFSWDSWVIAVPCQVDEVLIRCSLIVLYVLQRVKG